MGIRRLAIIDLVTGSQPVFSEDGSVACVFNGEIYNFQELRAGLERRGHRFKSVGDTEAIVHLYEEEGIDCVRRLRGMFAVAIWDDRTGALMLARDRLGKKPLYYAQTGNALWFASELAAMARVPGIDRSVDPVALDLYLTYSYVPAPYSIYRGVRKLPPAHVMVVRDNRVELSRYWELRMAPVWSGSRPELLQSLRSKLTDAVRVRMVSDVPLGCFLSGGTDSSAVVALMSRLSARPVKTFSIGFTSQRFDELPHARAVAKRFGTEHHEYVVEPRAIEDVPGLVRHFGEPYGDSSALPTWYVAQLARKDVTVALNGDGGDELFAGYPWYGNHERLGRLGRACPAWVTGILTRVPSRAGSRIRRLGRRLRMDPARRFASLRSGLDSELKARLYSPELLDHLAESADEYLIRYFKDGEGSDLARMQYTDMMSYLPEDLLVKVDRMTMAHSLEARSPLLDHDLVEFAARIPDAFKIDAGGTKALFREAIRDFFPEGFLDRPKMGFSMPVAEWLRGDLREWAHRSVCGESMLDRGWFARGGLRSLFDEHVQGKRDWSAQIWNLLMLAEWSATSVS